MFQQFNQIYFQLYQYENQAFSIQNQEVLHIKTETND